MQNISYKATFVNKLQTPYDGNCLFKYDNSSKWITILIIDIDAVFEQPLQALQRQSLHAGSNSQACQNKR